MDIQDDKGKVIAKVTAADPNVADCEEGVWVELQADDGSRPTLCLVRGRSGWYLGVYRDARKPGFACDLAISFDKQNGPILQVVRGEEVKSANLFDLVK